MSAKNKQRRRRPPNAQQRAAAAAEQTRAIEVELAGQADRAEIEAQLAAMTPEERVELEILRAAEAARREDEAAAMQQRFLLLTVDWALCFAYEPADLQGRVTLRNPFAPYCQRCGACLPKPLVPIPPLIRLPNEGDPYDRATPYCPNRMSEIRARQADAELEARVKKLATGTAFA